VTAGPKLLGIVNITEDSFSDGGLYLESAAALAHARSLAAQGADIVDLGAVASNPDAMPVPPSIEIGRLAPLVEALSRDGISLSIDSFAPETQRWALARKVDYLNDVGGFSWPELYPALAASHARLIVMHSRRGSDADEAPSTIFQQILAFFESRIAALVESGIARQRLVLDPGMGFFLSRDPESSYFVLRRISELKRAFELPLLVSVSRKSFLRAVTGRKPSKSGAATLAAELFAAAKGADYIRTHDPAALRDALTVAGQLGEGVQIQPGAGLAQISQQSDQNPLL
jgi:dihydropteroate synthase type 2